MNIGQVNELSALKFVDAFGSVYKNSPNIAHETHKRRPFRNKNELFEAFVRTVDKHSPARKLELIRKYDGLAGELTETKTLLPASTVTKKETGLNALNKDQRAALRELNDAYTAKFLFPLIICTNEIKKGQLLSVIKRRIEQDEPREIRETIEQIHRIAWHRINDMIKD